MIKYLREWCVAGGYIMTAGPAISFSALVPLWCSQLHSRLPFPIIISNVPIVPHTALLFHEACLISFILQQKDADPNLYSSGFSDSLRVHPCKNKTWQLKAAPRASVGEMHVDMLMEGDIYLHSPKCAGLRILPCPDERLVRGWS